MGGSVVRAREQTRARRRHDRSQYYLRSQSLAADLVARSSITKKDLVVEIGPGRGILTRVLAQASRRLIAVELDPELLDELGPEFEHLAHVDLVQGDFLEFPLPNGDYKVFSNIPFSITAAIVRRLLDAPVAPREAHLIVQLEAAERFAGRPYTSESAASLMIKPWWHVEIVRRLKHTDFAPQPSVDPVVLWLARLDPPLIPKSLAGRYRRLVTDSFGSRGNTMRQCLAGALTRRQLHRLSHDLRFELSGPPSALHFDQWLGLFRFLTISDRPRR